MRGDHRYHVDKVRRAFRYGAAMQAVFNPIMAAFYKGRGWAKSGMTPENVASANRKTRTAWRRCVEGLLEQGCLDRGQADPRDILIRAMFMRNCPPFGILPYPKDAHVCKHRFCPFCYGRRLIEGFKHIEMALYGTLHYKTPDGQQARPLRNDLMLVGFQVLYVEKYMKGEVAPPLFIRQMLPNLLAVAGEHRTAEAHAFSTVAGLVGHRVWCNMMGGIGVERSGVLLVRSSRGDGIRQYIKKHAKYNSRFVFSVWPNKQKMASLFADIFRYPTELLRCNPEYAAVLIESMEKKRLWAKVGSPVPVSQRECLSESLEVVEL